MNPDELREIVAAHRLWLQDCPGGKRADITGADLVDAYLRGADLSRANLEGADLTDADLTGATLVRADLTGADLRGATLVRADLTCASIVIADLRGASLGGASLGGANLADAIGAFKMPVKDGLGYDWYAIWHKDGPRIKAGCRWFTFQQARDHWLDPDYDGPESVKDTIEPALRAVWEWYVQEEKKQ